MGKSIVTGKLTSYRVSGLGVAEYQNGIPTPQLCNSATLKTQRGFSLLELMIAMFIMIILLSVAIPTYQRSVQQARETVLKENLWQMRRAIDQFTADKGKLPPSVAELVQGKYLRETPIDPVLEKAEWREIMGPDPTSEDADDGLIDVKSLAEGQDSNGLAYSEY